MPSLMPGRPGAKEVYGVSLVREDLTITVPPKAADSYGVSDGDLVVLAAARRGEVGFGLLNKAKAAATVLGRDTSQLEDNDAVQRVRGRPYAQTRVVDGRIRLTPQMAETFGLSRGDRLMVVKGARMAMTFTPVDLWREKLAKRGLHQALDSMGRLQEFC